MKAYKSLQISIIGIVLGSCISYQLPDAKTLDVSVPVHLQPTSVPLIMLSGDIASFDGFLITQDHLLREDELLYHMQKRMQLAYEAGRAEGTIVLQSVQQQHKHRWQMVCYIAGALLAGAVLGQYVGDNSAEKR